MNRLRLIASAAAVVLLGCGEGTPAPDREGSAGASDTDPRGTDPRGADAGARGALPSWYQQSRALDLTGDGVADSVRLVAAGTNPDSLRVTLTFVVGSTAMHEEEWGSSDELAHVDSALLAPPRVDSLLRARLDSVLASVRAQRFDDPGVVVMADDSAILRGLEPRPTNRISFSYGFETTVRLAWDAPRGRFVRLWSCC